MAQPLVSIIVPNYNYARYLPERMESILNQSFQDFEIILLDDSSTDNSREVIERYISNPKVSHIEINATNSGSTFRQWRKGISHANGKYIWIAEVDDLSEPDFLEKTVNALESTDDSIVAFTGSTAIDSEGKPKPYDVDNWKYWPYKQAGGMRVFDGHKYIVHSLYWNNYIYNASMTVFRKDAYEPSMLDDSIRMRNSGDWLFWIKMVAKGKVIEIYEKLNYFRIHSGSVTSRGNNNGNRLVEDFRVMKYVETHFPVGLYRRLICRGQYIKEIKRAPQYVPEEKKEILGIMHDTLGSTQNTYRIERVNRALGHIIPGLISQKKDRL
ncbi:glycosyltransferase family 2 protein [uncultured Muribaculum sp.]|uniref:glycosyltransferase family 2 protein n=1 Tax=uncultured Muribaculum sp. TaxID=1918613 RepID=UPI002629F643|nr:glycosyltransferase family 2 protein [uncultured Muribaculum sp.]